MSPKSKPAVEDGPRECSIADALGLFGDRWTLLVVRGCGYGNHRFNDIQGRTGASRDILAARLRRLEEAGSCGASATATTRRADRQPRLAFLRRAPPRQTVCAGCSETIRPEDLRYSE